MKTRYFKHRTGFLDGTDYISYHEGLTIAHKNNGATTNISACWPLKELLRFTEDGTFREVSYPTVVAIKKVAKRWRKVPMADVRLVFRHRTVAVNDLDEADFRISDLLRVEIKS